MRNAIKFTHEGAIRLIASYCDESNQLKVHVIDTGIGIEQNEMSMIFNKFGKALRTASVNSEGIGLGLMVCKELVKLNDGTISVHSEGKDKGSTFSF